MIMTDLAQEKCGERATTEFAREHPLRILTSDDNHINRRVLSLLLQRFGYQSDTTENGRDCLKAALTRPYDLLLIDVDMPGMSGIECTELIRQASLDFPIVAVTATSPEVSQEKSFAAGMTGFITKPVRVEQLKQVLLEASHAKKRKAGLSAPPAGHR